MSYLKGDNGERTEQFPNMRFASLTDEKLVIFGNPLVSAASQNAICAGESRRNE